MQSTLLTWGWLGPYENIRVVHPAISVIWATRFCICISILDWGFRPYSSIRTWIIKNRVQLASYMTQIPVKICAIWPQEVERKSQDFGHWPFNWEWLITLFDHHYPELYIHLKLHVRSVQKFLVAVMTVWDLCAVLSDNQSYHDTKNQKIIQYLDGGHF